MRLHKNKPLLQPHYPVREENVLIKGALLHFSIAYPFSVKNLMVGLE